MHGWFCPIWKSLYFEKPGKPFWHPQVARRLNFDPSKIRIKLWSGPSPVHFYHPQTKFGQCFYNFCQSFYSQGGCTPPPPRQTHPRQTHTPLDNHPPPGRPPWPLKRGVRNLLECILVLVWSQFSAPKRDQNKIPIDNHHKAIYGSIINECSSPGCSGNWFSGGSRISPRWGCQPSGGSPTHDFAKFSQKLRKIERIWTPGELWSQWNPA